MISIICWVFALPLALASPPPDTEASQAERVSELLHQARRHLDEDERAEALALIDEALLIDQESAWARAMHWAADDGPGIEYLLVDHRVARRIVETNMTVDYDRVALETVFDDLERRVGVAIVVGWEGLAKIGVGRDDRVTLKTENTSAAEVLDAIVRLVGDSTRPRWRLGEHRVMVATSGALRERVWSRVYDVRDLVGARDNAAQRRAVKTLIDRLRAIDPDGWHDRGGERNRLHELHGHLVITSTPWNHRAIESMLAELREERSG